jgi:hypothetical protein
MMIIIIIIIILGSCTRKTFSRFTTKDSYTWNITHNTESTAVWSLKPERWASLLVQEKYQEEKACDTKQQQYQKQRNNTNNNKPVVNIVFARSDNPSSCWAGTRWRSWLRHCVISRKVAGSIPNGVIGIFHWHNLSDSTMALGSTQLSTEMSASNISWG